jgi:hypothetical protein
MRYTTLSGIAALATVLANGVSTVPAVADPGISVPCDTTALTTAIGGASAGSTLVLARHCTYHLMGRIRAGGETAARSRQQVSTAATGAVRALWSDRAPAGRPGGRDCR